MASIVIPSSSPPFRFRDADNKAQTPPQREREFVPDSQSSESLPSLSKLLRPPGDTRLRTGSRAETVPEDAMPGFQSASRLLQFRLLSLCDQSKEEEEKRRTREEIVTTSKLKKRAKKGNAGNETTGVVAMDTIDQQASANILAVQISSDLGAGKSSRTRKRKSTGSCEEPTEVLSVQFKASIPEPASAVDATVKDSVVKARKRRKVVKQNGVVPIAGAKHAQKKACRRKTEKSSAHFATEASSTELPQENPVQEIFEDVELPALPKMGAMPVKDAGRLSTPREDPTIYEVPSSPARSTQEPEPAEPLLLEPAIKRKTRWTPVRDDPQIDHPARETAIHECPQSITDEMLTSVSTEPQLKVLSPTTGFKHLQQQFAFNANTTAFPAAPSVESQAPVNVLGHAPRKIDVIPYCPAVVSKLAKPAEAAAKVSATKAKRKSPKKAFRSITDRAIEAYRPVAAPDALRLSPQFAPIFEQPNTKPPSPGRVDGKEAEKDKPRKRRKIKNGSTKSKKSAPKIKAAVIQDPKLLSPEQHQARLERQDVMFGTSSQLRTDASPRFIRSMQQAYCESLEAVPEEAQRSTAPIRLCLTGAKRRVAGKMWQQALCVDDEGFSILDGHDSGAVDETREAAMEQMLKCEQIAWAEEVVKSKEAEPQSIEAVKAPRSQPSLPSKFEPSPVNPELRRSITQAVDDGFIDIDAVVQAPDKERGVNAGPNSKPPSLQACTTRERAAKSPTPPSHQPALQSIVPVFRRTVVNMVTTSPTRVALKPISTNTKPASGASSFTTSGKLSTISTSAPAEAATKRARGRPRKNAVDASPAAAPKPRGRPRKEQPQASLNASPKRRGRPPKNADPLSRTPRKASTNAKLDSEGFQRIDDIEDSEPDMTPPTPSRRGRPSTSPPILRLTSAAEDIDPAGKKRANSHVLNATHPRWPAMQAKLFPEIAAAIKNVPPTHDLRRLTWHEKMLLYDPIVLEDLTAWLNDQGLKVEGKDSEPAELSEWMVQRWCESQSVICLWREGLRGGVRVRY